MKMLSGNSTLVLDEHSGSLISLKNRQRREFLSETKLPLFTLSLIEDGERKQYTAADFPVITTKRNNTKTVICFTGFREMAVQATIQKCKDGFCFTLEVNNPVRETVEWINYPNLLCKDMLKDGFRVLLPMLEGVEISDFSLRKIYYPYEELKYPSGGWDGEYPGSAPLQCLAYYDGQEGMYFSSQDTQLKLKQIDCQDREDGLYFVNRVFGMGDAEHYEYGYGLCLKLYDGGFYEAAEEYRQFVQCSGMLSIPKLRERRLPSWTQESPVVVVYAIRGERDTGKMDEQPCYYPYTNALPILEKLKEELDSDLMVLMAHWEGTAPWAPPYVWPPYGDAANFRVFSEKLHDMGCHFGLYCSGLGWTKHSVIWPQYDKLFDYTEGQFADIMCVDADENHAESKICRGAIRFGHDMCVAQKQTYDIVLNEIQQMVQGCQVDYIQFFDQNIGGLPCLCYSTKHEHPAVPGQWLAQEQSNLIEEMYRIAGKDILIGCEGAASEAFMDKLRFNDARNYMGFPIGQPRPLFDYVYHEYVSNFMGNQNTVSCYVFTDEAPEIIFYKTAYFFAQGNVLTVVLGKNGKLHWDWGTPWEAKPLDHAAYAAFVKELNGWRKESLYEELQYGRMVKPLEIQCGEYVVPSYYGYYPSFHQGDSHYGKNRFYESVITNAYVTKKGFTQIFVNFSYKTQQFTVNLGTEKLIKIFTDKSDLVGKDVVAAGELTLTIAPRSVIKIMTK